jgi:CubicO group peptidase (beta-lactamase class C family)
MTAACMGMLVDEGKLNWDDPVTKHLPGFQLYDPYVTRELRVRDLFLHNTGVGNTDFLWGDNILTSDEVLDHMKLAKPSYSMRSGFIYQNIFYLVAGKVIEKISGMPWQAFVTQRIFQPLGMKSTRATFSLVKDPNISGAHYRIDSTVTIIQHDTADVIAPAGAVWSNIDDIALWVGCMLDSGIYAGGRLVKPNTWKELLKPQTIVSENQFYPTQTLTRPNFITYALGWFQQDYMGRKLNFHTGSLSGAVAIHGQMPEERTGVYIFGNLDHAEIRHALMFKAFDQYATGGNRDWSTEFLNHYTNLKKESAKRIKDAEAKRVMGTHPGLALDAYTGKYEDPLYGSVEIVMKDGVLATLINKIQTATLEHWNYDTFRVSYDKKWYDKSYLSFRLDTGGKVAEVVFDGITLKKVESK